LQKKKNFNLFSIDNLPYANEIIEDSLKTEMRDIGYTTISADEKRFLPMK
jgi:hypothetical protein